MGLGIGAGLLAGARMTTTSLSWSLLAVALALTCLILVTVPQVRPYLLCVLAGIAISLAVAEIRGTGESVLVPPAPGPSLESIVSDDPEMGSIGSRVPMRWLDAGGNQHRANMYLPLSAQAGKGDIVRVRGDVRLDGNSPFVFADRVQVVAPATGIEQWRRTIRTYSEQSMIDHVPGSAGSLTLGLLIGDDTALSAAEGDALRASGLSHITAVSGWNVSVVVVSVGAVFRAFGARRWRWLAVQLVMLGAYVWIVGLDPPIVRAAIMGTVALVALQIGRPSHMLTHLGIAAGLMAALNPSILESLSFQLSFMAMLGLAVAARICQNLEGWRAALISPAIAATAAGVATAPVLAATFGTLALMTVPANMMVAPLVPITTFGGIATVATSWLWPVADIAGILTWIPATFVLHLSRFFANVPGGYHEFAPLSTPAVVLIYATIALALALVFPEGRALVRKVESCAAADPLPAFATGAVAVAVLGLGLQVV